MRKIVNQSLYKALLEPGDTVNFSHGENSPIYSAVFSGYRSDGFLGMVMSKINGNDDLRMYAYDPVFYAESQNDLLRQLVQERGAKVNQGYVSFLLGAQKIFGEAKHDEKFRDADTVLADIICDVNPFVSESATELLDIWKQSKDQRSIEAAFESLLGVSFTEFLVRSADAIIESSRA
jgi:hypothetical protein